MEEGNKKRRLGKGLSELLGEARGEKGRNTIDNTAKAPAPDISDDVPRETLQETEVLLQEIEKKLSFMVPIEKIEPNQEQPRRHFDTEELQNLARSIAEFGVIQPLIVVKHKSSDNYLLVAGERRWRASQLVGLKEVPVVLKDYDMSDIMQVALIENIQRTDLNPIDEALGYMQLINKYEMTQNELGARIGKSRSYIANMMRMLNLDTSIQAKLQSGELSVGHAKVLASLPEEQALSLTEEVIQRGMNVRDLEKRIAKLRQPVSQPVKKEPVKDEDTMALEADLAAALGIKVKINGTGGQGGHVVLSYSTLEELDEICRRLCQVADNFSE